MLYYQVQMVRQRGIQMQKKKLGITEQIQDMKDKGITFNITDEKEALSFLKNNTIVESYRFVSKTVNYFCSKYRK